MVRTHQIYITILLCNCQLSCVFKWNVGRVDKIAWGRDVDFDPFLTSIWRDISIHSHHQQRCENYVQMAALIAKTLVQSKARPQQVPCYLLMCYGVSSEAKERRTFWCHAIDYHCSLAIVISMAAVAYSLSFVIHISFLSLKLLLFPASRQASCGLLIIGWLLLLATESDTIAINLSCGGGYVWVHVSPPSSC